MVASLLVSINVMSTYQARRSDSTQERSEAAISRKRGALRYALPLGLTTNPDLRNCGVKNAVIWGAHAPSRAHFGALAEISGKVRDGEESIRLRSEQTVRSQTNSSHR